MSKPASTTGMQPFRIEQQGVCAPLRKFYAMNDVTLNWEKIHNYLGSHDKTIEDKAYTKEQIRKLLQFASQHPRILILLIVEVEIATSSPSECNIRIIAIHV
jgi:hypothetical protein